MALRLENLRKFGIFLVCAAGPDVDLADWHFVMVQIQLTGIFVKRSYKIARLKVDSWNLMGLKIPSEHIE
ncbi:hypothetical protein D3C81_2257470 [compost metagenome]